MPPVRGDGVPAPHPMHMLRMLRIVLVDYNAIRRCKLIPYPLLSQTHNALYVKCGLILTPDSAIPQNIDLDAVGEVYMLPYSPYTHSAVPNNPHFAPPRTITFPTHPNHSLTVAHLHESNGKPWSYCPRERLRRAVQLLASHHLTMRAGFEMEFVLLEGDPSIPSSLKPFGSSAGYALHGPLNRAANILDHMVAALQQADIHVTMMHTEAGHGQFEIVLAHQPVIRAVDDLVMAREIVRAVAERHSLYATFIPKFGAVGTGSHVHFSLEGQFGQPTKLYDQHVGMSPLAQHFVAGVLEALPWLTFLTNASAVSYLRLLPQHWVGVYKVWGISNKETPLRLALDRTNMELKLLDGVSNPYLAMAGIIAAGLNGVRSDMQLPPPCQMDPHCLDADKRAERLPKSLQESLERFRDLGSSGVVEDIFPQHVVQSLIAVKTDEIRSVKEVGIDNWARKMAAVH
ncbi:unnamed protein product [Agarophyton chilense]